MRPETRRRRAGVSGPSARATIPPPPRLPAAVPRSGLSAEAQLALRQLLEDHARALAHAFAGGADARALTAARAALVARVVAQVWTLHLGEPHGLAVFAQGGFGRGRLFPYSDVDLLVLAAGDAVPASRGLERVFAVLWDLNLKPAQAVRTLEEQRRLSAGDLSIYTAQLEARWLAGDEALADAPRRLRRPDPWSAPAFLAARLQEHAGRHTRRGGDPFRLEPDLKEGPGGLRHLDLLYWLGLHAGVPPQWSRLQRAGWVDSAAAAALAAAEDELLRDRYALHLLAGRAEERLLFDHQRTLASRLGHADAEGVLGVERFMQGYYRAATTVAALVDEAVARHADRLHPPPPPRALDALWQRRGHALEPRDAEALRRQPALLLAGARWLDADAGIEAFGVEAARAARLALAQQPAGALAQDADALRAFDALLARGAAAAAALRQLARLGVLAALLPAFARVSGRMQYDLFHLYTVDEHTLRVLDQLAAFAAPAAAGEFGLAHALWMQAGDPAVLLLAALFHDIAKGRGGDHSVLGESDVRAFAQRLGWPPARVEDAAFLVREHLLLSQTAQRQDIGDPQVVARFAARVGSLPRLEMLYLLTVADIIGTSPALWNGFKDCLLADLYHAARRQLSGEPDAVDAAALARRCRADALRRLAAQGVAADAARTLWHDFPEAAFVRQRPEQLAWQTAAVLAAGGALPVLAAQPDSVRGGLELFFLVGDRDGLFATVTAVLEREGYSVQEARILGTPSGRALDSFVLLDAQGGAGSAAHARHLCARLDAALRGAPLPRARHRLPRRLRHFQRMPRVVFEPSTQVGRTRLAVRASDRPGLLADIAQAFLDCAVRVHDARIATFGDRAEDFFELSDRHDQPLDAPRQAALRAALERHLSPTPADETA